MAFKISEDQRFYLSKALAAPLDHENSGTYTYKVYASMEKRGWLWRTHDAHLHRHWTITGLGRTVARQLGIAEYAKDEQL